MNFFSDSNDDGYPSLKDSDFVPDGTLTDEDRNSSTREESEVSNESDVSEDKHFTLGNITAASVPAVSNVRNNSWILLDMDALH